MRIIFVVVAVIVLLFIFVRCRSGEVLFVFSLAGNQVFFFVRSILFFIFRVASFCFVLPPAFIFRSKYSSIFILFS